MKRAPAILVVLGAAVIASCEPIEPRPISNAPMNSCEDSACERYDPGRANAQPRCSSTNRCELPGARPDAPFFLLVHVPDTAVYAPGMTFVISDKDLDKSPPPNARPCPQTVTAPICVSLPEFALSTGFYRVLSKAAADVDFPLDITGEASIPVRVVYRQIGTIDEIPIEDVPLDVLFALPQRNGTNIEHSRFIPLGQYQRDVYPLPPFDAYFPPNSEPFTVRTTNFIDDFRLGTLQRQLDDVTGTSRVATITRVEGLEGWRVFLNDRVVNRRISTLKTLGPTSVAVVRLDTVGENNRGPNGGPGLGDDVDAIVAPPEGSIGIPRLVSRLLSGGGLGNLEYPELPPPIAFSGQVTGKVDGQTVGFPARVTFETLTGDLLRTRTGTDPLLSYTTSVTTDNTGRFATVVPPGRYTVRVEPAEGTGFANKILRGREIDETTIIESFEVDPKTRVRGRAVLSDNRPLADAEILATPTNRDPSAFRPRPGKARTDVDGNFQMLLDQGSYQFTIIPQAGTGFPWLVARHQVPPNETDLPLMRVPAPVRFGFSVRDPRNVNPIVRATVRVFGESAPGSRTYVELGSAMSDAQGNVEILLAQQVRP